jgi:hypothetical protein
MTSMEKSMQQMTALFPEEAVGCGASWRTTGEITVLDVTFLQTHLYTLESKEGDALQISMSMEQNVRKGVAGHVTGNGRIVIDINKFVPTHVSIALHEENLLEKSVVNVYLFVNPHRGGNGPHRVRKSRLGGEMMELNRLLRGKCRLN